MNKPNSHIQPLKKHLTALQNMQLAEALAVGEKFKEQGEEMKKERWKSGKNIDYRYIWTQFTLLQSSWMEDHSKELEKIGYAEWSNQVKDKFFEQFLEDCIIYDRHRLDELRTRVPNRVKGAVAIINYAQNGVKEGDRIEVRQREVLPDRTVEVIEALTKGGGLKIGVNISFEGIIIKDQLCIALADMLKKTGGFRSGVHLSLGGDINGSTTDYGIGCLADAIEKTGGLRKGVCLDIGGSSFTDKGFSLLARAIQNTGGLREGVSLGLECLFIADAGVKTLIDAINATGGLKEGVHINLTDSDITDEGVKLIAEMIKKSGGLKPGVFLELRENNITEASIDFMLDAIENSGGMPPASRVQLIGQHYNLSLQQQERISKLNGNADSQMKFFA